MSAFHSTTHSVEAETSHDTNDAAGHDSRMADEILPACSLLGIIAGFTAFVIFGQAVLPALIAAVVGALLGLPFACGERSPKTPGVTSTLRK